MGKQQPSVDQIIEEIGGSRYTLVVAAAKRARKITEGEPAMAKPLSNKPVLIALQEIADGKVKWEEPKTGIK